MTNTNQQTQATSDRQTGQAMIDLYEVPEWVPSDLHVDWAEKFQDCIDAGLGDAQAAKHADLMATRAIAMREARQG